MAWICMGVMLNAVTGRRDCHKASERLYHLEINSAGRRNHINSRTGDPSPCPSFPPNRRSVASQPVPSIHDRTYFQTGQERDAVGDRQDQGMAARLRAGAAARDRAIDGLDQL